MVDFSRGAERSKYLEICNYATKHHIALKTREAKTIKGQPIHSPVETEWCQAQPAKSKVNSNCLSDNASRSLHLTRPDIGVALGRMPYTWTVYRIIGQSKSAIDRSRPVFQIS